MTFWDEPGSLGSRLVCATPRLDNGVVDLKRLKQIHIPLTRSKGGVKAKVADVASCIPPIKLVDANRREVIGSPIIHVSLDPETRLIVDFSTSIRPQAGVA
jgi:hypothetical protein